MKWPNLFSESSPTDHGPLNSSLAETETEQYANDRWSFQENKIFEKALAEFEAKASPAFFEHVASKMPWKSIESIFLHYQALMKDIEVIESSGFGFQDYFKADEGTKIDEALSSSILSSSLQQKNPVTKEGRKKSIPWTEEEHKLFLMGLNEFGEGKWKSISKRYVTTKSRAQVASHAQKFNLRKTCKNKRRQSINDIQFVDSTFSRKHKKATPNATENLVLPQPLPPPQVYTKNSNYYYNINVINDHEAGDYKFVDALMAQSRMNHQ